MDDAELRGRLRKYRYITGRKDSPTILFLEDIYEYAQIARGTGLKFLYERGKVTREVRNRLERAIIAAETGALTKREGLLWIGPATRAMPGLISIDLEGGFGLKMVPKRHETYENLPSIQDVFRSKRV